MATNKNETSKGSGFAIPSDNYKYMLIGFGIVVLGYLLMIGGGSSDPNVFNPEMFNAQRTIVAPVVVLIGYVFEIWAIMRTPKEETQS
jgi:hypothetical protein